jgi:hypothetical protein
MADGINIRSLPKVTSMLQDDLLILDRSIIGTQIISFSSVVLSGSQVSFYNDFLNLSATTTTLISGGVSPSGSIIPQRLGTFYFAANTKDYFVSVGTLTNKDWKRVLTVGY